jgi:hypothetical protein
VRTALLADPELSERQKQVLIEIYESFRRENGITEGAEDDNRSPAALTGGAPGSEADTLTVAMELGAEDGDPDETGPGENEKPDKTAWRAATGSSSDNSVSD